MTRLLTAIFILFSKMAFAQSIVSYGIFAGINIPFTIDQGLRNDPRYLEKFTVRYSPFGFNYSYSGNRFGVILTPQYLRTGQSFYIRNTVGGIVGSRDVLMDFVSLPVAVKIRLADVSFFSLSLVAGVNLQYLVDGRELISHEAAKLRFPSTVAVPDLPGYIETFDGVLVPEVDELEYVSKDNFKPFQLFAALGIRGDYNISEDWSINLDGRVNFGIVDPREDSYINSLKAPGDVSDLFGERRDIYVSAAIGIARTIEIKQKFNRDRLMQRSGKKKSPKATYKRPR
jgi:hypothetical protein